MGALNRSVVAPLSSAIVTVLIAGLVVAGIDTVDRNTVKPGTARLEPSGVVEVSVEGAPFVRASHGRTLRARDQVRVIDGRAVLELPNSKVELRSGSVVTVNGNVEPELVLNDGDLLVEAGRGDTVGIDGGTSVVSVAGSAKLRRGVSLAAGVYEGTARLQRNDEGLTIPQYRQAAVVGTGILPPAPDPLSLAPSDEWDRRMLGAVMALDEQLALIARAFEADAPGSATPDLFKQWVPRAAPLPITPELLAGRAVGENLVGITLVALDDGDFMARFQAIFGFRAQGASWGLVAADRAINPNPVLSALELALARAHPEVALPPGGGLAAPGGGGRFFNFGGRLIPIGGGGSADGLDGLLGDGSGGSGGGGGSGGTGRGPGGSGGTGGSGGSGGSGGPGGGGSGGGGTPGGGGGDAKLIDVPQTGTFLDPLLNPLITPVEDLLSGLLGGLLGQGAPTSGTGSTPTGSVTQPAGTTTQPAGTTTPPAPTAPTSDGTTSTGLLTGILPGILSPAPTNIGSTSSSTDSGGTTVTGSVSAPTSPSTTTTTTRPPATTTTTTSSPGLLGGIVGGLTKTVGSLL